MILEHLDIAKYTFSGHDSFQCRQLWLKKGFDYVSEGRKFNSEDAVVLLGVGKNMVSAIRFWLKAFNIIDDKDSPTEFGRLLFDDQTGVDPFLEDDASLWLLHYHLVKSGFSTIYTIIFNEFRKEKILFNKEIFVRYIKRLAESNPALSFSESTISKDFMVFTNLYKHDADSKNIEDSFSGILSEIDLLKSTDKGRKEQYFIENNERKGLPKDVVLYAILDNANYGDSISLNSLEFDVNSPASIFALNRSGLVEKISEIVNKYPDDITYTDQAGVKELQIKNKLDANVIIRKYYGK